MVPRVIPLPPPSGDRDVLARIRAGDTAAFERVFRAYHPSLCNFASRYTYARDVAQELVHDVFVRLWQERDRLDVRESLRSYLYTAVRNQAISHLRHELVEERWRERARRAADTADPDDHGSLETAMEARELGEAVDRALAELPERCRMALVLRWQRQMSYAEIAEAMGISVKTVENYLGRGLAALRQRWEALAPYR